MGAQTSRVPLPKETIAWHRTKLRPEVSSAMHQTSDWRGACQTLGFLGMLLLWAMLALLCQHAGQRLLMVVFVLLYGMQANFLINGMHELGHGFVFRTRWLNGVFMRVLSFLGWLHPDMFFSSHLRHHRYTQNAPLDQENPMPVLLTWRDFASFGFINVAGCFSVLSETVRAALGIYPTGHLGWLPGWEEICYPPADPKARLPAMRWAQALLVGHGLIAAAALAHGLYLVPVLVSFGPFYNGWLFWLCNSTQHIGLQHGHFSEPKSIVSDFRLNTRTFYLNPLVGFWYWHMNYHTEHHMYAAVPCYNLARLHQEIKHELPATHGLVGTWRGIAEAMRAQAADPAYQVPIALPEPKAAAAGSSSKQD